MAAKKENRVRRSKKTRARIKQQEAFRLSVFRSSQHIYLQLIDDLEHRIIATVSTLDKDIKSDLKSTGNIEAAKKVGAKMASLIKGLALDRQVAFDRSGFKFHGRVKAVAEATGLFTEHST